MRIGRNKPLRGFGTALVGAAVGAVILVPFLLWGSGRAPEFFGAFTAAIVAAIAVVLGAYYQADLTRQRDNELRRQAQIAEATDLCFWLEYAANEMDFIAEALKATQNSLVKKTKTALRHPWSSFVRSLPRIL